MDVADLSHERGSRTSTTRRSANTRDRRAQRPAAGATRPESGRIAAESPATERTAAAVDPAAPDTADQLQADYFLRLLVQRRRLIDQRIEDYQRAIATAEAKGDVDAVCGFRRLTRIEEHDRQMLDGMLGKLSRRFTSRRAPGEVPTVLPRTRLAVRPAAPGLG